MKKVIGFAALVAMITLAAAPAGAEHQQDDTCADCRRVREERVHQEREEEQPTDTDGSTEEPELRPTRTSRILDLPIIDYRDGDDRHGDHEVVIEVI